MPSIILSDNGVSSGSAGLKTTAASDGSLALQTTTAGGTATTAVTIGTDQSVTFAQPANLPNTFGFKNRIINGAMVIDQRNAGAVVTPTSSNPYTLDRWQAFNSTAGSKYTAQQSSTAPAGFTKSLLLTSSSAYTAGATDFYLIDQVIEGYNVADLGWGAAGAASVTLSFWVRSSLTGTFGGVLKSYAGTAASYPYTYTINSANTWEQKSIVIPGPTSGWSSSTTNGGGIEVIFGLGVGSTYSAAAGSWTGTGNIFSATGATSLVGTSGATLYITGVQLEKGSTATSFDYRPYGTELVLCQRYCIAIAAGNAHALYGAGMNYATNSGSAYSALPVQMRAAPTVTYGTQTELGVWNSSGNTLQCTSVSANGSFPFGFGTTYNVSSGLTAGNAGVFKDRGNGLSSILATAEL